MGILDIFTKSATEEEVNHTTASSSSTGLAGTTSGSTIVTTTSNTFTTHPSHIAITPGCGCPMCNPSNAAGSWTSAGFGVSGPYLGQLPYMTKEEQEELSNLK